MKRISIILAIAMAVIMTVMAGCKNGMRSKIYPLAGEVIGVNEDLNLVTFSTSNGNKFSFYGIEDYAEGDRVAAIMDDNGTEIVYDDIVIMVNYQG